MFNRHIVARLYRTGRGAPEYICLFNERRALWYGGRLCASRSENCLCAVNKFDTRQLLRQYRWFMEKLCTINTPRVIKVRWNVQRARCIAVDTRPWFRERVFFFPTPNESSTCFPYNETYFFQIYLQYYFASNSFNVRAAKPKLEEARISCGYYKWYGNEAAAAISRSEMLENVYVIHNPRALYFGVVECTRHATTGGRKVIS